MRNPTKGLRSMKNMFSLILIASIMMLPSCEIPTDLNDNPNAVSYTHLTLPTSDLV